MATAEVRSRGSLLRRGTLSWGGRPVRAAIVSALAAFGLILMHGASAYASPSVSDVEKQINALWAQAEPKIEMYNKIHEEYNKNKAKQQALEKQIQPLALKVDLKQSMIGVLAAQVYKGGQMNALDAVLTDGSPAVLADQLEYLDLFAKEQESRLADVSALKAKYDAKKAPIDQLVTKLAEQDAQLAQQKKEIEAQLNQLQALRLKLYGSTGNTGVLRPVACPQEVLPTNGYKAAKFACSQIGKPYVWAAAGPSSYDCSGITLASWRQVGVYLPHNAREQYYSMPHVSRSNLRIGDLVFYNNLAHVGIYVGNGWVVHAPTFGDHVRMAHIDSAGSIYGYGRPG